MTFESRVSAIMAERFTERQARFMVTVMLQSGVCMIRQYCAFGHMVYGQTARDFFAQLLDRKLATAYGCAHKRARIFHIRNRSLYEAIGEPHNRFRKPVPLGRAIERLMLLDAVLARNDVNWLATERDKLAHFTRLLGTQLRRDEFPCLVFGQGTNATTRFFPDKLPIGVDAEQRSHVFTYLVTRSAPVDFRAFLHRHAELLRALPWWTIRLVIPPHLRDAAKTYLAAAHQELASPLRPALVEELLWYFEAQRRPAPETVRYERARRAFSASRYRALYRAWLRDGLRALESTTSPVLSNAIGRGAGRVEVQVLPRSYLHLSPLVSTS